MTSIWLGCSLLVAAGIHQNSDGLRSLADKRRLNFGAAVQSDFVKNNVDGGLYVKSILNDYNMIEPENDLKPPALWQGFDKYDFTKTDFLIDWARKNKLKVRGHVLVYARDDGYTIPRWLMDKEKDITPDDAKKILRDYIMAVAGRYKGKIIAWDVINEAIDDRPNDRPFNLRNSFWFRKLGADFLVYAFQYAHEADPKCKLYYNDYSVENGGPKTENLLKLADFLKSKGAPIHGIGLQFHRWAVEKPKPGDGFYTLLNQIQERKLKFSVTELDLSIPIVRKERTDPDYGLVAANPDDLTKQVESWEAFMTMFLSFKNCEAIQLWGINDKRSWIPDSTRGTRGAALLLDKDYKPKASYHAVAKVLKSKGR